MRKKTQKGIATKKIKILGISAAATQNSRSELLLSSLLDEFSKSGYTVKKIFVRNLNISFCDGFRDCEKTSICKFTDGMQLLEREILSSAVVVVSAPIYFTSIPAKLKAIVDRCQLYWARKNILRNFKTKLKKGIFISLAGGERSDFSHAETIIKAFFSIFDIKFCGKFYLPNTDKINDKQFSKALEDVKKLKRRFKDESGY